MILAKFTDRKGFTKELNLEGDYPPPSYRFAALPKMEVRMEEEIELPKNSSVEIVEFFLYDECVDGKQKIAIYREA